METTIDLFGRIDLNPKQGDIVGSDKRALCVQGGFGSGKSVTLQGDMLSFALDNPRSSVLVLRKTYDQVVDSVIADLRDKFTSPDPAQRLWPEEILLGGNWDSAFKMNDRKPSLELVNGTQLQFRGIIHDGREDPKKFGSVPFAGVYIEEFSELKEPTTFKYLDGRCRQKTTPDGYNRIVMVGNPPDQSHWSQHEFRELPRQNPAIAARRGFYILPTRDNVMHLPIDYIENMEATYSRSWVKRYLEGHTGIIEVGQPVLMHAFNPETATGAPWHVAEGDIEHAYEYPVLRGWDFGVAYASCVWAQVIPDPYPHVVVLHELTHRQTSALHFAPVVKLTSAIKFPDCKFVDIGDPSGKNRSLSDRRSPFDVLRDEFKIDVIKAPTNEIEKRKDAMVDLLSRTARGGRPFLQVANTSGTEFLRDALEVGWAYPTDGEGYVGRIEPIKNEYSHCADALSYLAVHIENEVDTEADKKRVSRYRKPRENNANWKVA